MKNLRLRFLFKKYLDQDYTPTEFSELMLLISDQSNDEQLKGLIDAAGSELPSKQLNSHHAEAIYQAIINDSKKVKRNKLKFNSTRFLSVAASILMALGATFFLFRPNRTKIKVSPLIVTKTTNDHRQVRLSDGSTVILNKNSDIEYPAVFKGSTREITLVGEAYFDIHHDDHKPFLVHVGDLTVTVLGTAFNIKSDSEGKNIAVTVTRGKVSVTKSQKLLATLTPDRQINIADASLQTRTINVDANRVIEWQADDIYFDDVTMEAAVKILERKFNSKIKFDSERVKYCTLTGTFTHNENLSHILKVICSFNNAKYETGTDQTIHITGPGCR